MIMKSAAPNEPGRQWRVLAHREDGKVELENQGKFDELAVDDWLHIEQMDDRGWWLRVGDVRLFVTTPETEPPTVDVERGCYGPAKGATRSWRLNQMTAE
jgi:hypothetical protein